jgi:hypothetical protein
LQKLLLNLFASLNLGGTFTTESFFVRNLGSGGVICTDVLQVVFKNLELLFLGSMSELP